LCILALSVAAGCSSSSRTSGNSDNNPSTGNIAISTQHLSGKIGGQAWSLGTAETDSFLTTTDRFFVNMYSETFTACSTDSATANSNRLILNLPKTTGSYNLSISLIETFYVASTSDNLGAISGRIQIDSVTAATITGGLNMTFDSENTVDGQFEVAVCP